jgi:hypothetical protein
MGLKNSEREYLRALIPCIGLFLLLGLQGCVTVHPAEHPNDPVAVYLADYGIHSAVILPTPEMNYVEYCYGDWPFAVENRDFGPIDGPRALFFSFQAGFGRRFEEVNPITGDPVVPKSDPALEKLTRFYAARADVYALVAQLDARYKSDKGPPKTNALNGNVYVMDNEHYSLLHNCNHLTAEMLEKLGCRVDGIVIVNGFSIDPPKEDPSVTPLPVLPRDATAVASPAPVVVAPKVVSNQ